MSTLGMQPGVSVIIPTWNRGETLRCAVESALNQTLPPQEVLVCDDGSTDGSQRIIEELGDVRIRWLPGERAGRAAIPRNRGIAAAQGEWIAFLDSDDTWLPEKLERQLERARSCDVRAVCSDAWRLVPDGRAGEERLLGGADVMLGFRDLVRVNRVVCSSAVLHRSLFPAIGGFPEGAEFTVGEDYVLWLKAATLTDFAFVGAPLVVYRDDPKTSIRAEGRGEREQRIAIFGHIAHWAGANAEHRFRVSARRVVRSERYLKPVQAAARVVYRFIWKCVR